jgi:hypothetical protein
MKNIKSYTDFLNEEVGEKFSKRRFGEATWPEKPFKREFTKEERDFLHRNFSEHSWSNIDNKGRIILGGGEEARGLFYITEEDLKKFMNAEK